MDWIAKYQTLFVGGVGFAGVIVTLLVNAAIARGQHKRQAEHSAEILRRALLAELQAAATSIEKRIGQLREQIESETYGYVPDGRFTTYFDSAKANLGALTDSQIEPVILAYAALGEMPDRIRLFVPKDRWSERGVSVRPEERNVVLAVNEGTLRWVKDAIAALKA